MERLIGQIQGVLLATNKSLLDGFNAILDEHGKLSKELNELKSEQDTVKKD
jgi:hypothetical protein